MHPLIRKALRITFVAVALVSIVIGAGDIADGVELAHDSDGRVRPWGGVINVVFGLLLLGFTLPPAWWRDPDV